MPGCTRDAAAGHEARPVVWQPGHGNRGCCWVATDGTKGLPAWAGRCRGQLRAARFTGTSVRGGRRWQRRRSGEPWAAGRAGSEAENLGLWRARDALRGFLFSPARSPWKGSGCGSLLRMTSPALSQPLQALPRPSQHPSSARRTPPVERSPQAPRKLASNHGRPREFAGGCAAPPAPFFQAGKRLWAAASSGRAIRERCEPGRALTPVAPPLGASPALQTIQAATKFGSKAGTKGGKTVAKTVAKKPAKNTSSGAAFWVRHRRFPPPAARAPVQTASPPALALRPCCRRREAWQPGLRRQPEAAAAGRPSPLDSPLIPAAAESVVGTAS